MSDRDRAVNDAMKKQLIKEIKDVVYSATKHSVQEVNKHTTAQINAVKDEALLYQKYRQLTPRNQNLIHDIMNSLKKSQ